MFSVGRRSKDTFLSLPSLFKVDSIFADFQHNKKRHHSSLMSTSPPKKPDFVVPPTIKDWKWKDDYFLDRQKKRMSVEIQRQTNIGSFDPQLYKKQVILEHDDECGGDYLPDECCGRLWIKFAYDPHEECLAVCLMKIRFVPRRQLDDSAPDLVLGVTMLPHDRRHYQSQTYESTTDYDFTDTDECYIFQVPKSASLIAEWALRIRLYDAGRRNNTIGGAIVLLAPLIAALNNEQDSPPNSPSSSSSTQRPNDEANVKVTIQTLDFKPVLGEDGDEIIATNTVVKASKITPENSPGPASPPTGSGVSGFRFTFIQIQF